MIVKFGHTTSSYVNHVFIKYMKNTVLKTHMYYQRLQKGGKRG